MSDRLEAIGRASVQVADARRALHSSILEARAAGEPVPAIAQAAGVTRQRVYQILRSNRDSSPIEDEARKRERLAEIDAAYDAIVSAMAQGRPGDYKRVTALQNGYARKLRARGIREKTVAEMMRDQAENELLALLERKPNHPIVQKAIGLLDEAAAIRKELTALDDARAFGEAI